MPGEPFRLPDALPVIDPVGPRIVGWYPRPEEPKLGMAVRGRGTEPVLRLHPGGAVWILLDPGRTSELALYVPDAEGYLIPARPR